MAAVSTDRYPPPQYMTISVFVSGNIFLQIAFQNTFAEMHRLFGVLLVPFGILAHVHEHGFRILGEAFPRLVDGDFLHVRTRFVDEFQKSRRMIHGGKVNSALFVVQTKTVCVLEASHVAKDCVITRLRD